MNSNIKYDKQNRRKSGGSKNTFSQHSAVTVTTFSAYSPTLFTQRLRNVAATKTLLRGGFVYLH